ncbi:MAG: SpaH/EbpB family LPXTG-anchored major pilin [Clostridia bacterium]|nr:SpaH/EbpB family LPXTG-anchored major pilin [Clostridia bacterium]
MKNKSRMILAVLLALTLAFSVTIFSTAAGTGTITINRGSETVSMKGHTYNAYKLFDVTYDATTQNYSYTLVAPYDTYFTNLNLSDDLGEDLDAKAYAYVKAKEGDDEALQAFAEDIFQSAGSPDGTVTATAADTAVIEQLEPGYYLVYDAGSTNPADNAERAIANIALTTANPNQTIVLKASVPTIDKKITGVDDAATNDVSTQAANGDAVSEQINQHIGFQIDSVVPDLLGYDTYTYSVKDTMTEGLTPDNNVKVTIKTTELVPVTDYTVVYNGQETTVTIPYETLKRFDADDAIAITYSAMVNENAKVYPSKEGNQAELTYSTKVQDQTTSETTPPSTVSVYRFSLDIDKVNASGQALANAEFVLQDNDNDSYIPVVLDTATGKYKVDVDGTADAAHATVKSDANGKIIIDGVLEGNYKLTETKAPTGYNLLKNSVVFNVTATYDNGVCTSVSGNTATIVNRAGGLLPTTGGIGTYIFTIGGALLMIGAVAYYVLKKRRAIAE